MRGDECGAREGRDKSYCLRAAFGKHTISFRPSPRLAYIYRGKHFLKNRLNPPLSNASPLRYWRSLTTEEKKRSQDYININRRTNGNERFRTTSTRHHQVDCPKGSMKFSSGSLDGCIFPHQSVFIKNSPPPLSLSLSLYWIHFSLFPLQKLPTEASARHCLTIETSNCFCLLE